MTRVKVQLNSQIADVQSWEFLPFRFERLSEDRVLVTNQVGEHIFLSASQFDRLVERRFVEEDAYLVRRLRGKHFIRACGETLPIELLAMKVRTQYDRLSQFTGLHIFVVTLRCDHACPYCQVSRQNSRAELFDMSRETADRALEATFRSPAKNLKIEFQGGEPLLNFALIEYVVERAERINTQHGKDLAFVIATNLALLDDHVIKFARAHDIYFSTSLDGPADLHNRNRPRPGGDSWERTVAGIAKIQKELGPHRVSALMTTTEASLERPEEIIDAYVELGLVNIFLRPLSPYGFAIRTKSHSAYDVSRWLEFYERGLDHIIALNAADVPVIETYAAIILSKMLQNYDPGFVDLASPAGIGIRAIVYNYDADVYASDEGRMLAEMGDKTFRMGNLHSDSYTDFMTSDALLDPLDTSFAQSSPMCSDCAFESYCGSDPVFHHATTGDFLGRKPESSFHQRNSSIFKLLLERYEGEPTTRRLFDSWTRR